MNIFTIYPYLKIIHLISLISFMAGIFYLPRLFVYHSMQDVNSGEAKLLEIMEYRLLKYIVNPAFIATFISGSALSYIFLRDSINSNYWLYGKFICFLGFGVYHMLCCKYRKKFLADTKFHTDKFFRIFNEVPTILMIVMICLVILK